MEDTLVSEWQFKILMNVSTGNQETIVELLSFFKTISPEKESSYTSTLPSVVRVKPSTTAHSHVIVPLDQV